MQLPTPRRLYPLRPHPEQTRLVQSAARFKVVPAGRRSGKTERAKRKVVTAALTATEWDDARFFAGAPTRDQAKAIYWADLKAMFDRRLLARPPSETDLSIKLVNGAEVWVIGLDKPERIEGRPWNGGILDEFANMKARTWGEHVRPALSDRRGWCWLIGVPEGRNHYYDLWRYARAEGDPEWDGFTWKSADILDPAEVAAAKRQLDPLVYEQEYEASFVNFEGRAYYPFLEATHTASLKYDDRSTISFCFDFNVEPGVAAVLQEQLLPGQYQRDMKTGAVLLDKPIVGTGVIGEVWIPNNSNTPAVCRKLLTDWGSHQGAIRCYGDATGGARGSAKVQGSDWDLIKHTLRHGSSEHGIKGFGDRVEYRVRAANPPERARVNAVNSRLKNGAGEIRLMVDPRRAPHVVQDLEGVRMLSGGSGEIDKKADPRLTHISDALGYYIEREFPIVDQRTTVSSLTL